MTAVGGNDGTFDVVAIGNLHQARVVSTPGRIDVSIGEGDGYGKTALLEWSAADQWNRIQRGGAGWWYRLALSRELIWIMAHNGQQEFSSAGAKWQLRGVGKWEEVGEIAPVEAFAIGHSGMEHGAVFFNGGAEVVDGRVGGQCRRVKVWGIGIWEQRNKVGIGHHRVEKQTASDGARMLRRVETSDWTADRVGDEQ